MKYFVLEAASRAILDSIFLSLVLTRSSHHFFNSAKNVNWFPQCTHFVTIQGTSTVVICNLFKTLSCSVQVMPAMFDWIWFWVSRACLVTIISFFLSSCYVLANTCCDEKKSGWIYLAINNTIITDVIFTGDRTNIENL